jgi:hypothetical protein
MFGFTKSPNRFLMLSSLLFAALLTVACSADTSPKSGYTLVKGQILIETDEGETPDNSGIRLMVLESRSGAPTDTLFSAQTDVDGNFEAIAKIPEKGTYPMLISRNERVLHITNLVFAANDTITITGKVPQLERTFRAASRENTAMETYDRVQRLYSRVATLAYGGRVQQDSIPILMNQWSDIFWSIQDQHPSTYASELAAIDAIEILDGWNPETMLERIESLSNSKIFLPVKLIYGSQLKAQTDGIDAGMRYLDNLGRVYNDVDQRISISMRKIELLVEFGENDRAIRELESLKRQNRSDENFVAWAESVSYEIQNLLPGRKMPAFEIALNASETVSNESLSGTYYLLEIVLLADANYQAVFPSLSELFQEIPDQKVRFISVPLDNNQITVEAFFEERTKRWSFANAGVFDDSGILTTLRIEQVPTRYLVGPDGVIINRYFTQEINVLRNDINRIIQN